MTVTFRFTTPYTITSPESRLEAAQQQAAENASAESDLSGFSGSKREYSGKTVTWTLKGIDAADVSSDTQQAMIDAIQKHFPGAAEFEIVEP